MVNGGAVMRTLLEVIMTKGIKNKKCMIDPDKIVVIYGGLVSIQRVERHRLKTFMIMKFGDGYCCDGESSSFF